MLSFENVEGHEQIIEHLQNAIRQKKVNHAYIFNGEKGCGKKLIARTFAKALQCEKQGLDACCECKSCLQTESENQPDIIKITHEKAGIGVEDIRLQINGDVSVKPYSSPYKIYIMADADKMTEQAQNALLKTIEEPPEYAVFLLLTDNVDRLLPTVLSRCIVLNLKPVSQELIKRHLMEKRGFPDYQAELSATFAQGNLGKAIRYAASEDFAGMKEDVLRMLRKIDRLELADLLEHIREFSQHKLEANDYIDLMILWYRDVLMFKVTKNPNVLLFKEELRFINEQASIRDYEGIENIIKAMEKAKERLRANVNFDTTMELMLLTIKENGNGNSSRSEI